MNTARVVKIFWLRRIIVKSLRSVFVIIMLLGFAGTSLAQNTGKPQEVMQALGKMKLADIKKSLPRGTESAVQTDPSSRLAKVGAVTKFTEPGGAVVYFFNRAGILVSAQSKATKPITKETLVREIKGITFKKYPPNDISVAFVRRSPTIIQGFYLGPDGRYVEYTTYDYLPR
jgi:hypothetical protein